MGKRKSELELLEDYRIVFENVNAISEIKTEMAEYGYDTQKMNEGQVLYQKAQQLFDKNKQETEEAKLAYKVFNQALDEVSKVYSKHRKIAKVALMKKKEFWSALHIEGTESDNYLKWIDDTKSFYTFGKSNEEVKPLLEKFKLSHQIMEQQLSKLEEVQSLRAKYEKEKGESQDATQQKNKAFAEIAEWIREFFAVAKIALDDRPQLLEGLRKLVRS